MTSLKSSAILFDGDDTLWITEPLYDDARARARILVASEGLDGEAWEAMERKIDVESVAVSGFAKSRFPNSCVGAYEELSARLGRSINPSVAKRIWQTASEVFVRRPQPMTAAIELLKRLSKFGYPLALITKGDPEVQRCRIAQSRLVKYFRLIEIVSHKSPEMILRIVATLNANPAESWMVGNSIRSDIIPAVEAGLRAIWIDSHVWEYERLDGFSHDRVVAVSSLEEVSKILTTNRRTICYAK